MSWSVSVIGKAEAVAKKLAEDFARITYLAPEEAAVKDAIAGAVAKALETTTGAVEVYASGSLSGGLQSASLKIDPKYGFVE